MQLHGQPIKRGLAKKKQEIVACLTTDNRTVFRISFMDNYPYSEPVCSIVLTLSNQMDASHVAAND